MLITELSDTKELHKLNWDDDNWDNFKYWYQSNHNLKNHLDYVDYHKVRHLETRIINPPSGVVKKFTMKIILDMNEKVSDYYDLSQLGNKNMFVQMVNTYYPLAKTKKFLKQLSSKD